MMSVVLNMQTDVKALSEKIEAMQNNEAHIFDPNEDPEPITQEGDGVKQ